ncbi:MAG TPA: hypothetical protein VH143_11915 [Kofleriaceae bacterium]|nr:hypothetical protein [Kofleriaceae bacterium]
MRLGWITVGIVVGACGRLDFDALGDGGAGNDGGSVRDGTLSSDAGYSGSGCLSPGSGDDFNESLPCKQWGEPVVDNATLNVSSGMLAITPDANAVATGGCLNSSLDFGAAGVFVHVLQYPNSGELQLAVTDTSTSTSWFIQATNQLDVTFGQSGGDLAQVGFDPSQTWLRIRPSGASVVFETSSDGESWTVQHSAAGAAPSPLGASIEEIVTAADPGVTILGGIDICP